LPRCLGKLFLGNAEIIVARSCDATDLGSLACSGFCDCPLFCSTIADDKATALTDLRIDEGGHGRLLLIDCGLTPAQAGRVVRSLLEIDLYRMLAHWLFRLPVSSRRRRCALNVSLPRLPICSSMPMQRASLCCSIA